MQIGGKQVLLLLAVGLLIVWATLSLMTVSSVTIVRDSATGEVARTVRNPRFERIRLARDFTGFGALACTGLWVIVRVYQSQFPSQAGHTRTPGT